MCLLVIKSWSNVDSDHELAMEDDVTASGCKTNRCKLSFLSVSTALLKKKRNLRRNLKAPEPHHRVLECFLELYMANKCLLIN